MARVAPARPRHRRRTALECRHRREVSQERRALQRDELRLRPRAHAGDPRDGGLLVSDRYVCADCAARPPRGDYMVFPEVWETAGMPYRGFLCLACLNKRLIASGRGPLTLGDFTLAPCNDS